MTEFYTGGKIGPRRCSIHGYELQPGSVKCWRCREMTKDERPLWWETLVPSVLAPIGEFIRRYPIELLIFGTIVFCVFLWWMGTH